jgi:hypothetical protein
MDKLRVRVYNVRFGDAILISVPDRTADGNTETRHILLDVGNVLGGQGGQDVVFEPVIRDVLDVLGGRPLDLYVMTHEHLDHVQGLFYASQKLNLMLTVRYAWLTASAAEDYYERHPDAKKKHDLVRATYDGIAGFLRASPELESPLIRTLLLNNSPSSTADCVKYLRTLVQPPTYVYRGCDLQGKHPFQEARFHIWAPEEDTAAYYGPFQPMALGVTPGGGEGAAATLTVPIPPPGVDVGAFYNLVEARRQGFVDNLLAIDRAANNTSVVFCLEWRGWKLLFPGDAEQRSWKTMNKHGVLEPVHFLKVGHHGSRNGTPPLELLDKIMPEVSPDGRPRHVAVSTCLDTYNNVPDDDTLDELGRRGQLHSVLGLSDGEFFDVEFPG